MITKIYVNLTARYENECFDYTRWNHLIVITQDNYSLISISEGSLDVMEKTRPSTSRQTPNGFAMICQKFVFSSSGTLCWTRESGIFIRWSCCLQLRNIILAKNRTSCALRVYKWLLISTTADRQLFEGFLSKQTKVIVPANAFVGVLVYADIYPLLICNSIAEIDQYKHSKFLRNSPYAVIFS